MIVMRDTGLLTRMARTCRNNGRLSVGISMLASIMMLVQVASLN